MKARVLRYKPSLLLAAALAAFASAGCDGAADYGGDIPSVATADPYGTCSRLADLLGDATWFQPGNMTSDGCVFPIDHHACVSGVTITAIDRYDETGKGAIGNYYVQDSSLEPEPYSGITIFDPSFSPPDLRLAVGDVADAFGTLQEFQGPSPDGFEDCMTLPEIGGAMTLRFENGAVKPITVDLKELVKYDTARPYIGMLVQIKDVTISAKPTASGGRYTAPLQVLGLEQPLEADKVPKLDNELFDLESVGMDKGSHFSSVTGILTFFYNFKIAPRSAADLVP